MRGAAELLLVKGWHQHRQAARADWRHVEVPVGRHDEASWGRRSDRVLKFLVPIENVPAVRADQLVALHAGVVGARAASRRGRHGE